MSALRAALYYHRRGWRVVQIPAGEKGPRHKDWGNTRLTEEMLPPTFAPRWQGAECNIGIILGPKSGDLVDIDLDCPEALALVDIYLPTTGAEFGRTSKPRSHRLYISPGATYEEFTDPIANKVLFELRAEGRTGGAHQTMVPPSIHPSGEHVEWAGDTIEPLVLDAPVLRRRAVWLAIGCLTLSYVSESAARSPRPDLPNVLWEFDNELGRAAFRWLGQPTPDQPQERPRPRKAQHQRDLDVADVVQAIPNDCSWQDWVKIGMGIFNASKDRGDGFIIFDDFSAKSPKYDSRNTADKWSNFERSPPNRVSMGTLVYYAKKAGWKPGRSAS